MTGLVFLMLGVKDGGTLTPEPETLVLLGLLGRAGIVGREAGTALTAAVERGEAGTSARGEEGMRFSAPLVV